MRRLLQPAWVATGSLCDLPLEVFLDRGIKALVLDVDCTLLPRHSQVMPECVVQNWRGATTRDRALAAARSCIVSAPYYLDLHFPADIHYQFDPEASQQIWLA